VWCDGAYPWWGNAADQIVAREMRPFEATLTRLRAVTAPGSVGTFLLRAKVTSEP